MRCANKGFRCGSNMRGTVLAIGQRAGGISKREQCTQFRSQSPPRGGLLSPYFQDANGVSKGSLGECDGDIRAVV